MKLAFLYPTYDRGSCQHHFAGAYKDEEEAKACLLGDPYEHKNLELLDTETYEFKSYFWHSLYKTKVEDYDYEKSEDYNRDRKVTITEKYPQRGQEPEVIETRANEIYNRKSGKEYALYRAGWWDWRCDED